MPKSQRDGYRTFGYNTSEMSEVRVNADGWMVGDNWFDMDTDLDELRSTIVASITMYRHLQEAGVTLRNAARENRRERALLMLEDGASYTETAASTGISRQQLSRVFPGFGWSQSDGGKLGMAMRNSGMERPTRAQ